MVAVIPHGFDPISLSLDPVSFPGEPRGEKNKILMPSQAQFLEEAKGGVPGKIEFFQGVEDKCESFYLARSSCYHRAILQ